MQYLGGFRYARGVQFDPEIFDYVGIFVFALSGSVVAMRKDMDVVGLFALGLVTGLAGGIVRDMMLGATPVWALRNPLALVVPLVAAIIVALAPTLVERMEHPVLFFDALGLGLFAVVGASKATHAGVNPVAAVVVGTISAVGGGLVRDVLAGVVPQILSANSKLYAVPAALGASLTVIAQHTPLPDQIVMIVAIVGVAGIRLLALRYNWRAPVSRGRQRPSERSAAPSGGPYAS